MFGEMTHAEVAAELGLPQSTVRLIERTAFKKLRRALFVRGIEMRDLIDSVCQKKSTACTEDEGE